MRKKIYQITRWFWTECPPNIITFCFAMILLMLSVFLFKKYDYIADENNDNNFFI